MQASNEATSPRQRATVVIGDYELGPEIGKGSFAKVYRGLNKKTNTLVAIKSVVRSSLTRRLLENLETEINILRTVRHRSIVELIDCLKSRNHIHLVMEYCSLGDLSSYLRKRQEHAELRNEFGGLRMDVVRSFVRQLGDAMRFLRARDVIHRDIKTQNILLQPPPGYKMGESEANGVCPEIKVADFGFARNLPSSALAETLCGSPLYMAPEILRYEPYDAKADLWSIGAVIYEMITGRQPFQASNHVELARIIERTNDRILFPEGIDPVLRSLVAGLLKMNPAGRMSFEDFFAHPALQWPQPEEEETGEEAISRRRSAAREGETLDERGGIVQAMDNMALADAAPAPPHVYPPNPRPLPTHQHQQNNSNNQQHQQQQHQHQQHQHQQPGLLHRRPSLHEEALAEREYVVIEKRTVEMNFLADEMESSPRTPLTLYPPPPLPSNMHRAAPGVAKQMTVLARAIRHAVLPQNQEGFSAAEASVEAALGVRGFNPLDQELAETFEASGCLDVQEEMAMRRMEGLAYMAFAMAFLADMKWRQLPNNTPAAAVVSAVDALVDPENGYLSAGGISLEEAFALYLRALSLLQHAMREAGNYWAGLSANSPVSFRFNAAVQWVRTKFNQCLERAEALKLFGNGRIMELAGVEVVQVLYEQSLALGKVAALRELKWVEPLDCDRAYQLAIWMLSAILETTTVEEDGAGMGFDAGESAGEAEEIEMEDRTIVEQFIASIVKRREKLQKRLMQQQDNIN